MGESATKSLAASMAPPTSTQPAPFQGPSMIASARNSPELVDVRLQLARSTSAPPDLELSSKNVFAFSPGFEPREDYSRIFNLWGVTPETPTTSNTTIGSQSESVRTQVSGGLPSRAPIESNINAAAEWTTTASSPRTHLTSLDHHSCSAISSPPSSSQRSGADFVEPLSSPQHSSYATSSPLACHSSYYAYGEHRPPPLHPASPNGYPADEEVMSNLMQQMHVSQSNASAPQYTEPQNYGQSSNVQHVYYTKVPMVPMPVSPSWSPVSMPGVQRNAAICKFFAHGHCTRGQHCNFAHVTATKGTGMVGARIRAASSGAAQFRPRSNSSTKKGSKSRETYAHSPLFQLMAVIAAGNVIRAEDLCERVFMLAKDQHGCRLLQRALDEGGQDVFLVVYIEVFAHLNQLMTDPFGNYLCQKLLQCCGDQRRLDMLKKVAPDLVSVSLNIHGTRVVQKLVELMKTSEEIDIIGRSLQCSIVTLAKDLNGNHVIQRCLYHMPSSDKQFIYDIVASHCLSVATHKHGCCVLQRCIDYATDSQRAQLVHVVTENALELVQDAFGNYVVQYVLDFGSPDVCRSVMLQMVGNVSNLAVQKFSSNVIEKILKIAPQDIRDIFIEEICCDERVPRLLQDPYANYVIQKALAVCDPERFEALVLRIRPHVAALRVTSFGKRIQSKIVKRFPMLDPDDSSASATSAAIDSEVVTF